MENETPTVRYCGRQGANQDGSQQANQTVPQIRD